jgi:hypothetical protein
MMFFLHKRRLVKATNIRSVFGRDGRIMRTSSNPEVGGSNLITDNFTTTYYVFTTYYVS